MRLCLLLAGLLSMSMMAIPLMAAEPSAAEYAAAINVAGRQRMLSQKMAKEALFVVLLVDVDVQRKALTNTIKTFDESLKRLTNGDAEQGIPKPPDGAIAAQYGVVAKLWAPYRKAVEAVAGGTGDPAVVVTGSREILAATAKAVELYETAQKNAHGGTLGTVVNIAGRQRMLSQKMVKEALQIALGIESERSRTDLAATRALFARSQKGLEAGDADLGLPAAEAPAVIKQLAKVSSLWGDYQARLDAVAKSQPAMEDMVALSDLSTRILGEANRAVMLLESGGK
jgi:nitrate/nitrite-specific signal transduction histidine kinase